MLRAVRLAAKLGACDRSEDRGADPASSRALIQNVPPARLFDEMQKLLLSGHATETLRSLRAHGLLHGLLPLLDVILEQPLGQRFIEVALADTDARVREDKGVSPAFLFATLLWHEVLAQWNAAKARGDEAAAGAVRRDGPRARQRRRSGSRSRAGSRRRSRRSGRCSRASSSARARVRSGCSSIRASAPPTISCCCAAQAGEAAQRRSSTGGRASRTSDQASARRCCARGSAEEATPVARPRPQARARGRRRARAPRDEAPPPTSDRPSAIERR